MSKKVKRVVAHPNFYMMVEGVMARIDVGTTVEVVEPLGDEMILYLKTPVHEFIGKVGSHGDVKDGQALEVHMDLGKVHIFDAETGENLCLDNDS